MNNRRLRRLVRRTRRLFLRESAFWSAWVSDLVLHKIDGTNQSVGRLASRIAVILRGKNNPNYQPNVMPQEKIVVENIGKVKFTGKKLDQKIYYHYSGYPGGMKARKLKNVFEKTPKKVLWTAVNNMLAKNRLRSRIMKNLEIK